MNLRQFIDFSLDCYSSSVYRLTVIEAISPSLFLMKEFVTSESPWEKFHHRHTGLYP